jgi:ABC-type protease/lipase transport system fused ATPase/permease subunit
VTLIVATPMKGHFVHVISPIVEVIHVAKPWFPIKILEIALPSHNRSTLLSPFLFPSQ